MAVFCFFKQKTAYEMRISDWSSDVCSSDLSAQREDETGRGEGAGEDRSIGADLGEDESSPERPPAKAIAEAGRRQRGERGNADQQAGEGETVVAAPRRGGGRGRAQAHRSFSLCRLMG